MRFENSIQLTQTNLAFCFGGGVIGKKSFQDFWLVSSRTMTDSWFSFLQRWCCVSFFPNKLEGLCFYPRIQQMGRSMTFDDIINEFLRDWPTRSIWWNSYLMVFISLMYEWVLRLVMFKSSATSKYELQVSIPKICRQMYFFLPCCICIC